MITVGSLFSGIGGIDKGLEDTGGFKTIWFVEQDKYCQKAAAKHWPGVPCYGDIRNVDFTKRDGTEILVGGDPCPIRSRARSNGESRHPDLSGYFLKGVAGVKPVWILRENVPAPDSRYFIKSLECLGYRAVCLELDASSFTGQQRIRHFIVGCNQTKKLLRFIQLFNLKIVKGNYAPSLKTRQVTPALTCHRARYDSRDCYIYDGRIRILDGEERVALAGFPFGWLAGYSERRIAIMTGNAVVPQVAQWIGERILEAEKINRP